MRLLFLCGALAAGEFLASCFSSCADIWPIVAVAAILVALFGYGLRLRGWAFVFVFLLGTCLHLRASAPLEQTYREMPWVRGREWMLAKDKAETSYAANVRHGLSRRIVIGMEQDPETASLERALLLGERKGIPWRTKRLFLASGTLHVFAISGLHVIAFADVLTFLLAFTFLPRRLVGLAAIPLLWGYVTVIGCPPSAVRAATMATFSLFAPAVWRKPDGLRSWSLAFLLIHLVNPLMIVNVGNALSFAVMLAIVSVGEFVRDMPRWKQAFSVTVAAWAAGVPIAAHVFGSVTPGGLLANLVLITAAKLTVYAGTASVIFSYVSETLARHLNNLCAIGVRAMVLVADSVSRLPGAYLETRCWSVATCLEWYAALALIAVLAFRLRTRSHML